MTWTNSPSVLTKFACIISWALLSLIPIPTQVAYPNILGQRPKPKSTNNPKSNSGKDIKIAQPPPGQGGPGGTKKSLGRRCPGEPMPQPPLTALAPVTTTTNKPSNQKLQLRWGKATQQHPTFWFYVPYGASIQSSSFSLKDKKTGKYVYEANVPINSTPGVIRVSVPSEVTPLENGKWYEAYLSIKVKCQVGLSVDDAVAAWVLREDLSASLKQQLNQQTTQLQEAIFYAQNGFWYDALVKIAELKQKNLDEGGWKSLLDSAGIEAGLEAITEKQIANCCTPQSKPLP